MITILLWVVLGEGKGVSRSVTLWSRGAPIPGVYCAFPCSLPPPTGCLLLSARRGRRNIWYCPVSDGHCSRRAASDPLRRTGGPPGFQGASRHSHHLTRISRSSTPAHPRHMYDPHQERVGRERLSVETLGVGSPAFCDMPLLAGYGCPDKPLVLLPLVSY